MDIDMDPTAPDTANYQVQPYGYGPATASSDPYAQWRGGRFIPADTIYQTTPRWKEPVGPFSFGPFSSEYEPPYADFAMIQLDLPPLPASIAGAVPVDQGDVGALFESYAALFGNVSAPALLTGPSATPQRKC